MKKVNFESFSLKNDQLKTIFGGSDVVVPVTSTQQLADFNSARSNKDKR